MKKWVFLLFFINCFHFLQAQTDTTFWFVAPEVAQSHGDRPIVFRFATLSTPATITISQPANPGFPTQIINLGINAAQSLDLTPWIDIIENKPPNTVLNYGFKIVSTSPIMAYYECTPTCNCNPDIFTLKGKNALGTNFIVPFQSFLSNASYARSGFDIVASQNNTNITIVPTQDIVGHLANVPFVIVLQKGETFCGQAVSTASNLHLSGTTVISDKPITITINDDSMSGAPYGGCADLMGDQIIPIPLTGKEYITLKGYLNGPDKVYIVATQDNTILTIDGVNVGILNTTNTYTHSLSNPSAYIQADKPVYVLHTSGFGCEVGGAIVPPIVCTGSNVVAFVRSTNEFFALNILVPTGGENSFWLNGSQANVGAGIFQPVPGTSGSWMYAQLNGSSFIGVQMASRLENPSSKFHLGVIHGGSNTGCRYGYFSDFAAYQYEIQVNEDLLCSGDTLLLTTDSLPGATYNWTGPLGINSNGITLQLMGVVPAQSGNYIISGFTAGACELVPDTVAISIISTPTEPNIITNSPICLGDTLIATTGLNSSFTFDWSFNNTTTFQNDSISVANLTPGLYPISLFQSLGTCVSPLATDTILVLQAPLVSYTGILETCGDSIDFTSSNNIDLSDTIQIIQWYSNNGLIGTGANFNDVVSSQSAYSIENYWVELLTENGCFASDTFNITFNPFPIAPLSVDPQCDGETALFNSALTWISNTPPNVACNYNIQFGDGQSGSNPNTAHVFDSIGNYVAYLSVTSSEGCSTLDSVSFTITAIPQIYPTVIPACGQTATFSLDLDLNNYTFDQLYWSIPGVDDFAFLTFDHTFVNPGNYIATVNIEGTNDCDYNTQIPFTILPSVTIENLQIPNVITPNGDNINDELTMSNLFIDCTSFSLIILNRWGNVVYETDNDSPAFTGKDVSGKPLEPGVYFYKLTTNDGKELVGHVTVF